MNLLTIFSRYPNQEACIEHLEKVRWHSEPHCPHCDSVRVARKIDGERIGRWNCHACHRSYNVLANTVFCGTKIPLQKWFLCIGLMVNAKKACQVINWPATSTWCSPPLFTCKCASERRWVLRKLACFEASSKLMRPMWADAPATLHLLPLGNNPRGRGTRKTPVVGVVERGGRVVAQVAKGLTGKALLRFIKSTVDPDGSLLITDEYRGYRAIERAFRHLVIDHSKAYAQRLAHTNTIEGVLSLIKRAWHGSHHHYSKRYALLYVAEACYKYNQRENDNAFGTFVRGCFA